MNRIKASRIAVILAAVAAASPVYAEPSLGLSRSIVATERVDGGVPLVAGGVATPVYVSDADFAGVRRAAADLQGDVERVSGVKPEMLTSAAAKPTAVLIGTLGRGGVIDELAKAGKIDVSAIEGKWESFVIAVVEKPLPGVDRALVIAGSDKRGTIYGIYEVSEQIGVSPWYWWADVPPKKHDTLFIKPGAVVQGPPAIKYRGIFINDEEPAFGPWTRAKFGGVNSKMYTRMFELLLRMRANYLWPAMWGKAFNEDDPLNPQLADEYGIVMGTSHHEPLMRAQLEWTKHRKAYGNGEWNYSTNEAGLKKFWADGVSRNKAYENLYTMGVRGDGDVAMPDAGGIEANKKVLEKIIADQQAILAEHVNPDVSKLPQLWALFTEVQQYYDAGLKLPESVTMLFTDDNVGNLRRVPTPAERARPGGAGIYYHMDMNGGPFSYKWLNSNPLPKVWEQMNLAYEYGAREIWIVNVGDLKPLEVPLEFFIRFAWDPKAMPKEKVAEYQRRWAEREFGPEHADEIADMVARYTKYNAWRKPEVLRADTYSLTNFREAERVSETWNTLAAQAKKLNDVIPASHKDAFYQLVLHPAQACANFVDLYIAAGRNALYAKQGRASANAEAARVRELFKKDQDYSDFYNNELAGGKWKHMMDQTHIGYTSWESPRRNVMPKLTELTLPDTADFGVAIDGSAEAWPGGKGSPTLPAFDSINRQTSHFDVFAKGTKPPKFAVSADRPWISLKQQKSPAAGDDQRVVVTIDWDKLPPGKNEGTISVEGDGKTTSVAVTATRATDAEAEKAAGAFGGLAGPIAFLAADAVKNEPVNGVRWEKIPDYGRGPSAMAVFPVTADTAAVGAAAPTLEYPVYVARPGDYTVTLVTGPTLNIVPTRCLGLGVSFDEQPPQVVNVFTPKTYKNEDFLGGAHGVNTRNNARTMTFPGHALSAGRHMLKLRMVDPTVVIQKVIVHDAPLPPSYFGPPEKAINLG